MCDVEDFGHQLPKHAAQTLCPAVHPEALTGVQHCPIGSATLEVGDWLVGALISIGTIGLQRNSGHYQSSIQ